MWAWSTASLNMADEYTWLDILYRREEHRSFMTKLKRSERKRKRILTADETQAVEDEETPIQHPKYDTKLEREIIEKLLSPVLNLPIADRMLIDKEDVTLVLEKLEAQGLINLQNDKDKSVTVTTLNLDRLSRIAENIGLTGGVDGIPRFNSISEELEWLLNAQSLRDRENRRVGGEIQELLNAKSFKEQLMIEKFQSVGGSQLREFCPHKTREDCRRSGTSGRACPRLHFRKIIQVHTDESLGDCSFLNTCFHLETCKFVHYTIDLTQETEPSQKNIGIKNSSLKPAQNTEIKLTPAQWVNCDLRSLDMSVLGKFSIVMADPPWDIHMELPYGKHIVIASLLILYWYVHLCLFNMPTVIY